MGTFSSNQFNPESVLCNLKFFLLLLSVQAYTRDVDESECC